MAYVPANNVVQVNIRQRILGQQAENTLYFLNSGGWDLESMAAVAEGVRDWWTTGPRAVLSQNNILSEIYLVDLTSQTGPTYTLSVANDPGGPRTGDSTPNSVALCVSFRTGSRGRSGRGRNYVGGWAESSVNGNSFVASDVDAVVAAYQTLVDTPIAAGVTWVVCSRQSGGQPRASALVQPIIAVLAVDDTVDSQRRRLPGRGR